MTLPVPPPGATPATGATDGAAGGPEDPRAPAEVVAALTALAARGPEITPGTRLVCVDGLAGAGKTTLAERLREAWADAGADVAVVHLDDLYEGWTGLLDVGQTVLREVVDPLAAGRDGQARRWDWIEGGWRGHVRVPRCAVVILEGCGSAPRGVDDVAALVVRVVAPDDVRLARGIARDGEALEASWRAFMADEATLEAREGTTARADVVLDERGAVVRWGGGRPWPDRVHGPPAS
ncbi:uridine kinase [Miniimonas sp. S16]|uniref:uridine kinase family protein n=1 Tax=Miniimonas sp. S16 TaxID=2171623 RepID=UPI001F442804|nr:uridine kinase [Miniimonas sp. S16]